MAVMHQLTQLAGDLHRQRLTHADRQRPAGRLLALARATRRADRARRRVTATTPGAMTASGATR
jgi:hypothetical protein